VVFDVLPICFEDEIKKVIVSKHELSRRGAVGGVDSWMLQLPSSSDPLRMRIWNTWLSQHWGVSFLALIMCRGDQRQRNVVVDLLLVSRVTKSRLGRCHGRDFSCSREQLFEFKMNYAQKRSRF
jgi:hypothetical protein